jgi:hypothetical protein
MTRPSLQIDKLVTQAQLGLDRTRALRRLAARKKRAKIRGARVAKLARTARGTDRRAFAAIDHNGRAIDRLELGQRQLEEQLRVLQTTGGFELLQRLAKSIAALERRVQVTARAQSTMLARRDQALHAAIARQKTTLTQQARSARIEKLNATATSLQTAAYGRPGSPVSFDNLLLAANQLFWAFAGDLLRLLGAKKIPGLLPWLSPLGNLVTGHLTLGRRQHERFISGVATDFTLTQSTDVGEGSAVPSLTRLSLRPFVGSAFWPELRRRTDLPVVTTVILPSGAEGGKPLPTPTATVRGGVLEIVFPVKVRRDTRVGWIVDTGA